jgi:MinD-like ATPase involved in chromosome partitioning or flagellar assembly
VPDSIEPEIICIASGKGGTGKTLIGASLGYALVLAGHRVLLVDTDTATHGLSLFLLGPNGKTDIRRFDKENTWAGLLSAYAEGREATAVARTIRRDVGDQVGHGVKYRVLASDLGIYGDDLFVEAPSAPSRTVFRSAAAAFISELRTAREYDYVLLDTRGGFSFESTDLCALTDSFILVTDADLTSFYQDRNLVRLVNEAAGELGRKPILRSIIVNRATDGEEQLFRTALTREFPVHFEQTHAIPLDLETMKAYKSQQIPYVAAPGSLFAFATLKAFAEILSVVTAEWNDEEVYRWNELVNKTSSAIQKRNEQLEADVREQKQREEELQSLRKDNADQRRLIENFEWEIRKSDDTHKRESRSRSMRNLVTMMLISLLVASGVFLVLSKTKDAQKKQMFIDSYKLELPLPLRVDYMRELVADGARTFPAIDLRGADLSRLQAPGISLRSARLYKVRLADANLSNADLSDADLQEADFSRANLQGANLRGSRLRGTNLSGSDLRNADLRGAYLADTVFQGANLVGAHLDKNADTP